MQVPSPDYEIVLTTSQRAECLEWRLVLDATGISAEAVFQDGAWLLVVSNDDLAIATEELDAYRRENPVKAVRPAVASPIYGGAAAAVLVYTGIMIYVAVLERKSTYGFEWLAAGRVQAGSVMAGEWWRTVTALTLHADVGHLLSNLAFGAVFGFLAGRILGGGVAWLVIVIAGALGNFINCMVQAPTHTSIGASTSVFAALGVLVSHALCPRGPAPENRFKRWSPLIGGVVLLAFTGIGGERTDVVAHLTGFLAGMLIGWLGCRLPNRWLASGNVQIAAGVTCVGIVTTAWIVGLAFAG